MSEKQERGKFRWAEDDECMSPTGRSNQIGSRHFVLRWTNQK